jgi:hypothetical protein
MDGVSGTGWGLFNAVTQFEDWNAGSSKSQDQRLFSSWFGGGQEKKDEVVQAIHLVARGTAPTVLQV